MPNIRGTDAVVHGTKAFNHGTDALVHGTKTFNHGTDALVHGTDANIRGKPANIPDKCPHIPGKLEPVYGEKTTLFFDASLMVLLVGARYFLRFGCFNALMPDMTNCAFSNAPAGVE